MSNTKPSPTLLAAYAVYQGKLHAMFEEDSAETRAIKFLGKAQAGQAVSGLDAWHDSALTSLNAHTTVEDHVSKPSVDGGTPGQPEELAPAPWYAIFESNPDGNAVGDLWVGRFFLNREGPSILVDRGVFIIAARSNVSILDDAPLLIGTRATRSVIFEHRNATGTPSADGDHGGTGTGAVRREW